MTRKFVRPITSGLIHSQVGTNLDVSNGRDIEINLPFVTASYRALPCGNLFLVKNGSGNDRAEGDTSSFLLD